MHLFICQHFQQIKSLTPLQTIEPVQGFVSRDGERDCTSVHSLDMSWIDLGVKTEGETAATPADLEASEFKAVPPVVKKPKLVQNKNFAGPSGLVDAVMEPFA